MVTLTPKSQSGAAATLKLLRVKLDDLLEQFALILLITRCSVSNQFTRSILRPLDITTLKYSIPTCHPTHLTYTGSVVHHTYFQKTFLAITGRRTVDKHRNRFHLCLSLLGELERI